MKIVVLDYTVGEVIIKDIPKEYEKLDGDDILTNMGFSMSNTSYMVVYDELTININNQVLQVK